MGSGDSNEVDGHTPMVVKVDLKSVLLVWFEVADVSVSPGQADVGGGRGEGAGRLGGGVLRKKLMSGKDDLVVHEF